MKKYFHLPLYAFVFSIILSFTADPGKKSGTSIYNVLPEKSAVVWIGKKVTGEHTGSVKISKGSLSLVNNKPDHGTFDIDLSSITVSDVKDPEGNTKLVNHLKGEDFFNTSKFPISHLEITKITALGQDNFEAAGNLTIKGITHPVTFPAVIKSTGKEISATGDIKIDRTKYDIKFRSANFFENLGDKTISDEFTLKVSLVAVL